MLAKLTSQIHRSTFAEHWPGSRFQSCTSNYSTWKFNIWPQSRRGAHLPLLNCPAVRSNARVLGRFPINIHTFAGVCVCVWCGVAHKGEAFDQFTDISPIARTIESFSAACPADWPHFWVWKGWELTGAVCIYSARTIHSHAPLTYACTKERPAVMDACVSFRPLHLASKISSLRIRRDRTEKYSLHRKRRCFGSLHERSRLLFLSLRLAQDYF